MNLPGEFIQRITSAFPDGADWLKRLPGLIDYAAARWHLQPGPAVHDLSYNYVAPALRADGSDCILKIGVPHRELTSEITALRLYAGQGACQIFKSDPAMGMFVLERLVPGQMLHQVGTDEQQTLIAAQVMRTLWRPAPSGQPLISLGTWFDELQDLRPRFHGGVGSFPLRLVQTVESLLPDLLADVHAPVVMHGDCHHFNILNSQRGWLAIDPKGVIGPAEYEPAPYLINPGPALLEMPSPVRLTERRIHLFAESLGLEARRIHAWAICHALLSAWWDADNEGQGGAYSLACGEVFLQCQAGSF